MTPILQQRFRYYMNTKFIATQLRLDVPTSEDPDVKAKLTAAGNAGGGAKAWECFAKLVTVAGLLLELVTTSGFVWATMRHQPAGGTIVALCMLSPMMDSLRYRRWYASE